jgi:aspartyl-tRNA(Asn)/glutamyl-tRNA(Gln) amidotransferase subunit C
MELTTKNIDQLAKLARLQFSEAETVQIRNDLARMISFVEKLQQLDTTGVEPLLHMTDITDIVREDRVMGSMDKTKAMELAPDADGQYFYVPKVIKK